MTTLDSSRVSPPAFDDLLECMNRISLPPVDGSLVPETVLPAFLSLREQFTDQHARTLKDIASMRLAWSCLATVAPQALGPSDAVALPASAAGSIVPPIPSSPTAAPDSRGTSAAHHAQRMQDAETQIDALKAKLRDLEHRPLMNMLQRVPVASMLGAAALQTAASVSASDDSLRTFALQKAQR